MYWFAGAVCSIPRQTSGDLNCSNSDLTVHTVSELVAPWLSALAKGGRSSVSTMGVLQGGSRPRAAGHRVPDERRECRQSGRIAGTGNKGSNPESGQKKGRRSNGAGEVSIAYVRNTMRVGRTDFPRDHRVGRVYRSSWYRGDDVPVGFECGATGS